MSKRPLAETQTPNLAPDAQYVLAAFEQKSGLFGLTAEVKSRFDGDYLVINVGNPTNRFFEMLQVLSGELSGNSRFCGRVTLAKVGRKVWLHSPESLLFQKVLSESLTIGRESLQEDFFDRYIPSVFGAESQIINAANHFVFGRRGSGKSSILVYAAKKIAEKRGAYVWISMQTYEKRRDENVTIDVLSEISEQLLQKYPANAELIELHSTLAQLRSTRAITTDEIRQLLPRVRRVLAPIATLAGGLMLFLDDIHVLPSDFQPQLLSHLYAISRGSKIWLKISAIENLTRNWDAATRLGLEIPNDAQAIRLDFNLTMPDKAKKHLQEIFDVNAAYCGLPSAQSLYGSGVLDRIVWVSAGVPRDAIYFLLQAISKATFLERRVVAVADINAAASDSADGKLRALEKDAGDEQHEVLAIFERLKSFCQSQRKNAFLVEIRNDASSFKSVLKLIDLRFLHVLSPGLTPHRAGRRYMALLLDYGFYVGIRTARSIELFQGAPKTPTYKELRSLPSYEE